MCSPTTESELAPAAASTTDSAWSRCPMWLIAVLLLLVTIALYWPATRCDFVNYDDQEYVTANPHVQHGLRWEAVKWVFCNPVVCNWHPLTLLSHMLDCQLFGLKPWGHHLTSVLLHAVNTALVFVLLCSLTGAFWRSVLVAPLFGLHPGHVESVVWVAERKDVLSTCFGLLALLFYVQYTRKVARGEGEDSNTSLDPPPPDPLPAPLSQGEGEASKQFSERPTLVPAPRSSAFGKSFPRSIRVQSVALDYSLALFFFACGLMSKPMLVTWPFVMLLLDYWPLHRFGLSTLNPQLSSLEPPAAVEVGCSKVDVGGSSFFCRLPALLLEKIPFFVLAATASIVTFLVQKSGGALDVGEQVPLAARSTNALILYCRYLGKVFWPTDLAVFYPHPGYWPTEEVLLASGLLLGISVLFI